MPEAPKTSGGTFALQPGADAFVVHTQRPKIKFLKQGVQPPSTVYVTVNDGIWLSVASSDPGEVVTLFYRLLRADGDLVDGSVTSELHPAYETHTRVIPMAEGFLLSVSVVAKNAVTRGVTFVRVFLGNANKVTDTARYTLMSDYVTTEASPAHPNGRQLSPVEGPGNIRVVTTANPGAGVEWNIAVPANARWKIRSGLASLTTSAAVGNRFVLIDYFTGGSNPFQGYADKVQAPSQATGYSLIPLTPYLSASPLSAMVALAPELSILSGGSIQSRTFGLAVADAWTNIILYVEEWLDNV